MEAHADADEVKEMFKRRTRGAAGGTALAVRPEAIVDTTEVVRILGERIVQRLWPIPSEVRLSRPLPMVIYAEDDFWRLVEILIGRALTAFGPMDSPALATVGAGSDGAVTIFSVHTRAPRVFTRQSAQGEFSEAHDYRTWEAKAIVERNGGRFWIDECNSDGSTAYFTIKS